MQTYRWPTFPLLWSLQGTKEERVLRPVVSSISTNSCECARYIATWPQFCPPCGQDAASCEEYQGFCGSGEEHQSRDWWRDKISLRLALDKGLDIIQDDTKDDTTVDKKTPTSPENITRLLVMCNNFSVDMFIFVYYFICFCRFYFFIIYYF